MQRPRKFAQKNYQLLIGVVIGLVCSLFLNELFRGSIIIWNASDIAKLSELISERNVVSTIPAENSSLHKNVKVLCWVMTCPQNHRTKAIHIKRTWGKRCDKLLFFSSQEGKWGFSKCRSEICNFEDSAIDSIAVPGAKDGRDWLWGKTKTALKYAWEHHKNEFDWIIKADDDTYVIVENLKKFLSNYSPAKPIFFGCQFSSDDMPDWPSGGAGYVLSKEALRRFVQEGLPDDEKCKMDDTGAEDAELSQCLLHVGAKLEDSRDSYGRHRFLAFKPVDHLFPKTLTDADKKYWYWKALTHPQVQGMNCCANDAITFHYIDQREMYVFEYFLYHLRPEGVDREQQYVQELPLELSQFTATTTKPK